jgi:hypothetical protein
MFSASFVWVVNTTTSSGTNIAEAKLTGSKTLSTRKNQYHTSYVQIVLCHLSLQALDSGVVNGCSPPSILDSPLAIIFSKIAVFAPP